MVLQGISWQVGTLAGKRSPRALARLRKFSDVKEWRQGPGDKPPGKIRIALFLKNAGAEQDELLVRYTLTAKLAPMQGEKKEGTWVVPFLLEEQRVPKLKPGQEKPMFVVHVDFKPYFDRVKSHGYWPEVIRIKAMVEPKNGEGLERHILESELPVVWR